MRLSRAVCFPMARLPTKTSAQRNAARGQGRLRRASEAGIACAFKNTGIGVGVNDIGRVKLKIENGRVLICTSAACMGQGIATVLVQIVGEAAGLDASLLAVHAPDTAVTPDSGTSTASRQTSITGEAARRAAFALRKQLEHHSLSQLEGRDIHGEYDCITDSITSEKESREPCLVWLCHPGGDARRRGPRRESSCRA